MTASLGVKTAAVLLLINGIGFGWPGVLAIRSLRAGQGIPLFMGFPAYGLGPFERYGVATTVALVAAFLVVCVLEIVSGVLVWNGSTRGALLALGLLPFGAVFWWGFALPIPPLFASARTILMLINWRTLT